MKHNNHFCSNFLFLHSTFIMSDLLAIEVRKEHLPESEVVLLQNGFIQFVQQVQNMKDAALAINVTSVDQVEDIKRARELRITIKNIRVDAEKVRKAMKEDSLRRGRAIDGMANVIKELIYPIETHLDNQEKFVELQEMKRIAELRAKRIIEIAQYNVDGNAFQNLGEMPEQQYALLLDGLKIQYEAAIAAAKKAIEREKNEAAERERIKAENEARRIENEQLQEKLAIEKQKAEAERIKREEAEQKERIAKQKLKETKQEIKEEKKAEEATPRARAFDAGVVTLDGKDFINAQKGDLFILLKDTKENRFVLSHLMRP